MTEFESIEFLDSFLKKLLILKENNYKACISYFLSFQSAKVVSFTEAEMILEKLVRDGYVIKIDKYRNNSNISIYENFLRYNYCLTFDGKVFIENEGYSKKFLYEKEKKQLELNQIQSVIDTNKSIRSVNRIFWVTVIIATSSAAASIKSCQNTIQQNKSVLELQSKDSTIQLLRKKLSQKETLPVVDRSRIESIKKNSSETTKIK